MPVNRTKKRKVVVAITGSPTVGKSHFAKKLARISKNVHIIEINDVVKKGRFFSSIDKDGVMTVKLAPLKKELKRKIIGLSGIVLVVGHLAPELNVKYDLAIVIRGHLRLLSRRMKARKYNFGKIRDNLVSEALDYCGIRMARLCKDTYEIETKEEIKTAMNFIMNFAKGKSKSMERKEINSMGELLEIINLGWKF